MGNVGIGCDKPRTHSNVFGAWDSNIGIILAFSLFVTNQARLSFFQRTTTIKDIGNGECQLKESENDSAASFSNLKQKDSFDVFQG